MNQFLEKYPHDVYVIGGDIDGRVSLRHVFAVGEGCDVRFATSVEDKTVVFTPGDYELLIKSSMIDTV